MSTLDLDTGAEREIDLSRWRRAVVSRWWIVAAGLVAGIVIGAVYSLSGGSVWEASALISPGQAFSPNGSPVLVYQASPLAINVIATSESALERAAAIAHVPIAQLRGNVSTSSISTGLGNATSRGSTLIKITVRSQKAKPAAAAANALGTIVRKDTTSPYVTQSLAEFTSKIKSYTAQLASVSLVIDGYNKVLATQKLDPFNKLILSTEVDNALLRQGNLNDKLTATQAELTLAQNIEITQFVSTAAAAKTTARSRRTSILVGALIGLIIGAIAAIVFDSRLRRARPS